MRFLVHRTDVEHFRWAKRIARKLLHTFVPENHIHSFTAELAAHGTYARASRPEAGGYGVHFGHSARYRHLRPDAGMACHRSNLDHSAANLRGLAFDETREHCRGNPGQDDGRIVGLDGVHRHPDGFLRIEDLVSALFFGRQPSLYRTEVDDEVLPFAAGDDRRFQLAHTVAVPFGAGEHPRGSEARLGVPRRPPVPRCGPPSRREPQPPPDLPGKTPRELPPLRPQFRDPAPPWPRASPRSTRDALFRHRGGRATRGRYCAKRPALLPVPRSR